MTTKKGNIIMGIFDDFEYKENYQNEEKVIEVLKKILRAIHLNNYRDIMDCVDGSEVDDVRELLEYIDDSLQLNDFDKIDEYGVECNFNPNYEYRLDSDSNFGQKLLNTKDNPSEIFKFLTVKQIMIPMNFDDNTREAGFICDCEWDIENGVGIKYINEQISEIGFQDILL